VVELSIGGSPEERSPGVLGSSSAVADPPGLTQSRHVGSPLDSALPYRLVRLPNGAHTVFAADYGEQMHPGAGPDAEAESLNVRQLKLRERLAAHEGVFVVWDVGLGIAANALTLLRCTRDLPAPLRVVSFDHTAGAAEFALAHADALPHLRGYESPLRELLTARRVEFQDGARRVEWELHLADFPSLLASDAARRLPPPHAIFHDAFSPAKNPAMWTLPLFARLFELLDPARPCALATYSRSTRVRVALLLAGFFVGRGTASGPKEETTVAANRPDLLDAPLDCRWLERARRSQCAEPLRQGRYERSPLRPETWEQLRRHPQFRVAPAQP
jgi:queuine tRNA-ribosyltransferase